MACIQARREVLEFGSVPLALLLPQIHTHLSLQEVHNQLFASSKVNEKGIRVVSSSDVAGFLSQPDNIGALSACLEAATPHSNSCFYNSADHSLASLSLFDLSLFLFAELYGREIVRPEATDHWPDASSSGQEASSRSGSSYKSGSSKSILRQQLQQHLKQQEQQFKGYAEYIKKNLPKLLQLVLDEPPPPGTTIDTLQVKNHEVDRLAFLLNVLESGSASPPDSTSGSHRTPAPSPSISSQLPCFSSSPSAPGHQVIASLTKSLTTDADYNPKFSTITNGIASIKINRSLGLVGSAGHVDASSVQGLYRGTVVRGEKDFLTGDLRILDCHDAVIYALAPLTRVIVSGCSDCTVILGAVGTILRAEKCEKLHLISAASHAIISSCHDCTFHLGVTSAPIVAGDNRYITLAPHNVRYERLHSHIQKARVRLDLPNQWNSPIVLQARERRSSLSRPESPRWYSTSPDSPRTMSATTGKSPVSFLPPEDFLPYSVPFKGGSGPMAGGCSSLSSVKWSSVGSRQHHPTTSFPFPLPDEYEKALASKHAFVSDLRGKIKSTVLEEPKRRELQSVIQSYFKEWLGASNNIRQVYDLSKLEVEDAGGASSGATSSGGS